MIGEQIVLVNRTGDMLSFVADGRHYDLLPGDNYGYQEGHASFAMRQNPLLGTEDYNTLDFISLVGVKGRTDCSEIGEDVLKAAKDAELFDIATMTPQAQQGRVKMAAAYRQQKGRIVSGAGSNSIGSRN